MTTYNGEKYISEQIKSLQDQSFTNWNLIISDDHSTDNTYALLNEYKDKEPRIIEVQLNDLNKKGPFTNFYGLIEKAKKKYRDQYDYYFYCDQDDIWDLNKLRDEIEILDQNPDIPCLVYTDLNLMDSDGNSLHQKISEFTDLEMKSGYEIFLKHRYIWGTTMAHNRALLDKVKLLNTLSNEFSHDNYLGKTAAVYGKLIYLDKATVYYRRHGNNVSGMPKEHSLALHFRFKHFLYYYSFIAYTSMYFLEANDIQSQFAKDYINCVKNGGKDAFRFFKKYQPKVTKGFLSYLYLLSIFYFKKVGNNKAIKDQYYFKGKRFD